MQNRGMTLNNSTKMLLKEKLRNYPAKFKRSEFLAENCPNGSLAHKINGRPSRFIVSLKFDNLTNEQVLAFGRLAKVAKLHTNPYNFEAYLPNPYVYKLSKKKSNI